jgi:4-amino-4-deoxy-L-arabinose transferase-like glycosyltransferase
VKFAPWRVVAALVACAACYLLFFHDLSGTGLLGPDEPRYAAIGREMARSGDWITPRLWGDPWFEKPPLLYWMEAIGFRAGLGEESAPRLPSALISVGFLVFFRLLLRREFGAPAALFSTVILATSAGWIAFSRIGVTDLPMAAAFSAAMLLCLPWVDGGDRRRLPAAAALLGLAVLAKGLVPLVLALPLILAARKHWRDLLRPGPLLAFFAVAAPWYIAVTLRYGNRFAGEFFLRHHFERFAGDALKHVQPFWFYVPVFVALLFPWSPLAALLFRRKLYEDPRTRFLLWWVAFGFLFFSAAANKLPGYLLPLLPAAAAAIGTRLARLQRPWLLVSSAGLLLVMPVVATILPEALSRGITHTDGALPGWPAFLPIAALAAAVWVLIRRRRAEWALLTVAAATVASAVWLQQATFPALDRTVSARSAWREIATRRDEACVGDVNRKWRYNLNYYSEVPLPDCRAVPRPIRIEQPGAPTSR